MATIPDFGALAQQQATNANAAADKTNQAQRPNQYGPMGSITWAQNPDGTWAQNTNLSGPAQGLFDSTIGWQQGLGSKVGAGAPEAGFGAQQNVIDAWGRLQEPGLQQSENAARARAAAMGITYGSDPYQTMEGGLTDARRKAQDNSILQGVNAYNQMFTNQLNSFNANRGAMTDMTGVRNSLDPNEWAAKTPTSAAYTPTNVYGAALDTYSAQRDQENAKQAQLNSYINAGGNVGSFLTNGGYGMVKDLAGAAWSGAKDLWNSWGSSGGGGSDFYPETTYWDDINYGL